VALISIYLRFYSCAKSYWLVTVAVWCIGCKELAKAFHSAAIRLWSITPHHTWPIRWHWSRFIFVFIAVPNSTGWWQWQCGALDARNSLKHFTQRQSDSDPLHHTIHYWCVSINVTVLWPMSLEPRPHLWSAVSSLLFAHHNSFYSRLPRVSSHCLSGPSPRSRGSARPKTASSLILRGHV